MAGDWSADAGRDVRDDRAASPTAGDARHLVGLRDRLGDPFLAGIVFHTGPRTFALGERITAAPISTLWAPG